MCSNGSLHTSEPLFSNDRLTVKRSKTKWIYSIIEVSQTVSMYFKCFSYTCSIDTIQSFKIDCLLLNKLTCINSRDADKIPSVFPFMF